MDESYIGTVLLWTAAFVPRGWALCDGSVLNITQNPALFAILGNRFGGDGRTTFQLPDLRNRVPMGLQTVDQPPGPTGAASHSVVLNGAAAGMVSASQLPPVGGNVSPGHSCEQRADTGQRDRYARSRGRAVQGEGEATSTSGNGRAMPRMRTSSRSMPP